MPRTLLLTSLVALGLASTLATATPKSVTSDAKRQTVADARSEGRTYPLDVLIYATGVAEFDLTSLRDYASKHGLTPEGFRQHVLKMQRRLGLAPRPMQHADAS